MAHSTQLVRLRLLLVSVALSLVGSFAAIEALGCNVGAYFDGIKCVLCPGGTFGARPGLVTSRCSGACASGYFCPEGSTSARQNVCGRSIYYCPPGSAMRQLVADGYYTIVAQSDPTFTAPLASSTRASHRNAASVQRMCEPGRFCVRGVRYPCAAGLFGEVYGQRSSACSGVCPLGFYCPLATANPVPCPAGTFGNMLGLTTAACSGRCPRGFYCESGTVTPVPCPAGTLGRAPGLATRDCSAQCTQLGSRAPFTTVCAPSPCPAGYYCPLGTLQAIPCGSTSVFCPTGSAAPTTVSSRFYSTWTTLGVSGDATGAYVDGTGAFAQQNQTTRSAQQNCDKGAYCISGVKRLCPAGVYGATTGLVTAACTAPCPAGYYCPIGSASATANPCTASDAFCRQGAAAPTPVTTGFYTTMLTSGTTTLRVDEVVCPLGSYCTNGIATLCPAGVYGATTGLATPQCSGRCRDGYTCKVGSTSATQTPCPAGSYSQNGVRCSPCAPGYWCAAGSPSREQHMCGSDTAFCPLGSASPVAVLTGYYAAGQQTTTHTSQTRCALRNVQHVPQCPTRTVGATSGL